MQLLLIIAYKIRSAFSHAMAARRQRGNASIKAFTKATQQELKIVKIDESGRCEVDLEIWYHSAVMKNWFTRGNARTRERHKETSRRQPLT